MIHHEKELPSNKTFGLFFCLVFFLSSTFCFYSNETFLTITFLNLALFFLVASIFSPNIFLSLNRAWMQLGYLLGLFFNPIILGVLFFGFFTPIAVLTRFFGRDELKLNFKKQQTYWKSVGNNNKTFKKTFRNQF